MAEFDTELNVREAQSFLNYSRGVDVNTQGDSSRGKLFSGLGDIISLGTKAVSEEFGRRIEQEAYAGVDEVRNEVIDGAVTMEKAPGAPVTPEEINRAGTQLDRLKQAAAQGKLPESHYQARVEAASRQLRAKYVGHREEIDAMISRVNGGNPANKLRDALYSEAEAAANLAKGAANRYETFVDSAIKDGRLTGTEAVMAKSGRLTQEEVYRTVADREYQDKSIARESANLSLRKARGEDVSRSTGEMLDAQTQNILNDTTSSAISVFSKDNKELNEFMRKAQAGQLTTKDGEGFIQLVRNGQLDAQTRLNRLIQESTTRGVNFSQPQIDAARKRVEGHFGGLIEAATNKDWGTIGEAKRMYDAQIDNEKLRFIQPEFQRRAATAKAVMGENIYLQALTLNSDSLRASQEHMKQYLLNGLATNSYSSFTEAVNDAKRLGTNNAEAVTTARQAAQAGLQIIADPKTPPRAVENLVESFFGPQNISALKSMTESSKAQTFQMFANPSVTKRMVDLKAQGREDLWNKYSSWVIENSFVYGMRPVSDLQARSTDDSVNYSVKWDASANHFIHTPSRPLKNASEAVAARTDEIKARTLVRELNSYTHPMVEIAKAEGLEPQARVAQYLRSSGINLDTITVNDRKQRLSQDDGTIENILSVPRFVADGFQYSGPGSRESTNVEDRRTQGPEAGSNKSKPEPKLDLNDPLSRALGGSLEAFRGGLKQLTPEQEDRLLKALSPQQIEEIFGPSPRR